MIRYLIKKGFVITHRNGSHARLVKNHMYTSVPAGNKTTKIGLQLSVLGDAMIAKEEFVNDQGRGCRINRPFGHKVIKN